MNERSDTILLADDDDNDVFFIQRLFKKCGVINPLQIVSDGDEAIAYLRGDGRFVDRNAYPVPFLLILDLRMNRLSGIDVLNWMQAHPEQAVTAIVLAEIGDQWLVKRAYEAGARIFQNKPLEDSFCHSLLRSFKGVEIRSATSCNHPQDTR